MSMLSLLFYVSSALMIFSIDDIDNIEDFVVLFCCLFGSGLASFQRLSMESEEYGVWLLYVCVTFCVCVVFVLSLCLCLCLFVFVYVFLLYFSLSIDMLVCVLDVCVMCVGCLSDLCW